MAVRLVLVDLDGDGLGLMRMIVAVVMVAAGAMHVRCRYHGRSDRRVTVPAMFTMVVPVIVAMAARNVSPAFGLKTFLCFIHDQAHGAQHVGQHVVGFNLE